jgi:hypothetical protein
MQKKHKCKDKGEGHTFHEIKVKEYEGDGKISHRKYVKLEESQEEREVETQCNGRKNGRM